MSVVRPDGNDDVLVELRGPPSSQPAAAGAPAARQPQAAGQNGAAPTSGTPVVFRELTYTVKSNTAKGENVALLKSLDGCFLPGEMSALMGPSGSGKTTLLDVLAGRKTQGTVAGEVLFSAQAPTTSFLRRFTGYVEQFDTLLDILTVREMLLYTAELKRSPREPLQRKAEVVDTFIDKLNLTSCKDVRIGSNLNRGISGGQAKRTNVALAMVVDPRVLFLDEPTSGLDSYTANEVMTVVKALAADGITVCATIHSPSPYCFDLFDRLMVLVRGEAVYFGPNGAAMMDYFRASSVPPPATLLQSAAIHNNADYLTDLVVGADREGRAGEYAEAYAASDTKRDMRLLIDRCAKSDTMNLSKEAQAELAVTRATATPTWKGFATLVKYRTTRNYRNPEFLGPRIGDKLIFSVLVATLYLGIGDDLGRTNLNNIAAVLFMWSTLPAFGAASYVPALTLEKPLFVRERADGLYRPITYLISKFFDEIFITIFASLAFSAFVFYIVDLGGDFVVFWLTYLLTLSCGICLAYVIAIISPNMDVANAALPAYTVTLLFFAGFLFRFDDMPPWWQWYAYLDFLRYAWGAQMINQFEDAVGPDGNPILFQNRPILEYFSLDGKSKWEMLGYELIFLVVFFLLAWAALQFKRLAKR